MRINIVLLSLLAISYAWSPLYAMEGGEAADFDPLATEAALPPECTEDQLRAILKYAEIMHHDQEKKLDRSKRSITIDQSAIPECIGQFTARLKQIRADNPQLYTALVAQFGDPNGPQTTEETSQVSGINKHLLVLYTGANQAYQLNYMQEGHSTYNRKRSVWESVGGLAGGIVTLISLIYAGAQGDNCA